MSEKFTPIMKNENTDVYSGTTSEMIRKRLQRAQTSGELESSDILSEDGDFIVTIFGYVRCGANPDFDKNVTKIFEDIFIHIFTRFDVIRSRNKLLPKLKF